MDQLPHEIIEIIFNYIPLVTYKFFFKNLSNMHYNLLNHKFNQDILSLKQKNKEWLLIELLVKEDLLAIYFVLDSLPTDYVIYLIIYLIQNNKLDVLKYLLLHPISIKYIDKLDYEYIDITIKKILDDSKQKYINQNPNPHV